MDHLKLGLKTYSRKNHGPNAHLEPRKYFLAYEDVEKVVDELQAKLDEKIRQDEDEIESDEIDRLAHEEETGTTPQDLYNERNAYGIQQGEMIDRFRNEI